MHVPVLVAPYGQPISISASGRCASPACSMTIGYRRADGFSGAGTVNYLFGPQAPFTEAAMTAGSVLALPDGTTLVPFSGSIPAAVTSTEGVDYYLALVDGATATRSPLVIEVLGDDGDLVGASGSITSRSCPGRRSFTYPTPAMPRARSSPSKRSSPCRRRCRR